MRVHNFRDISRKRRKTISQCLKEKFKIYCENTTLHGFRYVTVHQSTIIECVLWFLICIMSIIFCIILMLRLWHNYDANPTATVISTNKPIWSIYFPGVTICNNNKVYSPHAKIFGNILSKHGINHSQSEKFFISLMKLTRPDKIDVDNLIATRALEVLGFTVDRLMYELMQPCKSMLLRCAWLGQKFNCSDIFKAVKSREGYCCAFNYHFYLDRLYGYDNYDLKNTSEDSDRSNIPSEELPGIGEIQKAPGSGRDVGLAVALNIEAEHYKSSNSPFVGATVLIHDPHDYPDIGIHSITVLPGHTIGVGISASFGGIFGLCLGGSVISLVELLYYIIREFCYHHKGSTSSKRNLPAASELFLSAPLKDPKWKKLNTEREMNDDEGPVYVLANRMFIRQKEKDVNNGSSINKNKNNTKKVKFQRYYD
ncbi:hypothetical protein M0804_001221 [Polistes exclamans]|nr:hypothetical protein M0804_001221 [Polistes exclamans]